jgi:[ribosomal protein S18]-alanine N-acetyltransferase
MKSIDESDLDDLYKLNQEIFKEEILYDKDYLSRFCKLKQGYIMRKNDKTLIGYAIFGMTYCESQRIFTIVSIGVLNTYRGKGYGKMLLQTILDKYPTREISLHVRVTNKVAQKLYKSLGFEIKNIEEKYYHQLNDDAYHMVKKVVQ